MTLTSRPDGGLDISIAGGHFDGKATVWLINFDRAHTTAVDAELPAIDLVVGEPAEWTPGPTISNSFGFGGHNATLVLGPAPT